jgi:hypothetical protein
MSTLVDKVIEISNLDLLRILEEVFILVLEFLPEISIYTMKKQNIILNIHGK